MRKTAFNMVEIAIVVCLLLTTIVACLPAIFNNTRQAKIVSRWKALFAETKSNFEIFGLNDIESVKKVCSAAMLEEEDEVFKIISPYLNVDTGKDASNLKSYTYKFSNGAQIPMESVYFTRKFAYQDNGNIVGFKWNSCECDDKTACAMALFDMNGKKGPNRIGEDIFGINIYKTGIKAFGSEFSNEELEKDCIKGNGSGASCAEFYLRGGKF